MKINQTMLSKATIVVLLVSTTMLSFAQLPTDLPWAGSVCAGQDVILQNGIAAITCGTTVNVNPSDRYTFGLVNIDGALPTSGRTEVTNNQAVYHHPSWTIDQLGNVFGIAINEGNGCIFVTASSNYGSAFSSEFSTQVAVLQYGAIGGGANSLAAAGTVYKIDGVTGQATVFAQLPQQSTTLTHYDCELGTTVTRTSGVGLGNIVYDETHNQYFVSNMEDGRIYRLDAAGTILDSYDPLIYDDGAAGVSDLTDVAYGLAITDDGSRLFFGQIITPNAGLEVVGSGNVPIYAIDIQANGDFTGTIDNSLLPAGVPNNYVGTETLQTTIPVGSNGGCTFANDATYQISDLQFDSAGNLLVGVRIGCDNTISSSYNHWGETTIVMPDANGIYNMIGGEYDISVTGTCGNDDGYGGVAAWDVQDGSGDVQYLASSADILQESGPHGIVAFSSTAPTGTSVNPLGAISYGVVDTGDPKGVGGDVEVFNGCPAIFDLALDKVVASTNDLDGSGTITEGDEVVYTVTVYNQGTANATDIIIADYLPTGMSFASSADFTLNGATYEATIASLAAGASQPLSLVLSIDAGTTGTLTNNAEITSADDDGNPATTAPVDEDSPINASGSSDDTSEVATDNDIADDSTGGVDNPADDDTYDPAQIIVESSCPPVNCINQFGEFTIIKNRP